jgi:hypothetical protein
MRKEWLAALYFLFSDLMAALTSLTEPASAISTRRLGLRGSSLANRTASITVSSVASISTGSSMSSGSSSVSSSSASATFDGRVSV